ncbi:helix-turn-helix domain-containing protein, partial [Nonomuraea rhizosphaerae]|uniref:helix-turn-helix domain-containing protein n=1 Tax=Nonomuraea rhizosphaerae TaxID=2665663 RepID=UPI001C5FA658
MPGGRLSHDDRREISAGLAEGLGYAEIARRLGRPTSTISREVSRNGGAGGYRADQAHRATEGRARRSRPATS